MTVALTKLLSLLLALVASTSANSEVLNCAEDTTTKLDKPRNKRAGNDQLLRLRHDGTTDRDAYVKFDLDSLTGTHTNDNSNVDTSEAQLGFSLDTLSTGSNGQTKTRITVKAYKGGGWDTWTADTLTWNDADSLIQSSTGWPIDTLSVCAASVGNPFSFNVPVNILPGCDVALASGETCTLSGSITFQLLGDSDSTAKLPGSEHTVSGNKPTLIILANAPLPAPSSAP